MRNCLRGFLGQKSWGGQDRLGPVHRKAKEANGFGISLPDNVRKRLENHNQCGANWGPARGKPLEKPQTNPKGLGRPEGESPRRKSFHPQLVKSERCQGTLMDEAKVKDRGQRLW